jgi:hypothetical protein
MLEGKGEEAILVTVTAEGTEVRRTVHHACMVTNMAYHPESPGPALFDVDFTKSDVVLVVNLPDLLSGALAAPAQLIRLAVGAVTKFKSPKQSR